MKRPDWAYSSAIICFVAGVLCVATDNLYIGLANIAVAVWFFYQGYVKENP